MKKLAVASIVAVIFLSGCVNKKEVLRVEPTGDIGISKGDILPDITMTNLEGLVLTSESLRGKTVVITSSAAWCSTCELEAKEFAPIYKTYKDDDVVFITLDIDSRDSDEFIREFIKKTNTPWNYGNATKNTKAIETLAMSAFEVTYVIDKDGLIVFKDRAITPSDTLRSAVQLALSNN